MGVEKRNQIWKCGVCGNIVEILEVGGGSLVCCGKEMVLVVEKNKDVGMEKHVPLVEKTQNGFRVRVGSVEHPMLPEHFIEFIELIVGDKIYRQYLNPGMKPVAEFCIEEKDIKLVRAREYCNIHGLWVSG